MHTTCFAFYTPGIVNGNIFKLETKGTKKTPILNIDKSRSQTRPFAFLSRSLGPGFVLNYWKLEKFVKVSSCSHLGLKIKGTRLSVLSRSRSTVDYPKVSVSSICSFFKKSCAWSRCKIVVSSLSAETCTIDLTDRCNRLKILDHRKFASCLKHLNWCIIINS